MEDKSVLGDAIFKKLKNIFFPNLKEIREQQHVILMHMMILIGSYELFLYCLFRISGTCAIVATVTKGESIFPLSLKPQIFNYPMTKKNKNKTPNNNPTYFMPFALM